MPRRKPSHIDLIVYYRVLRTFIKRLSKLKYGNYAIISGSIIAVLLLSYVGDSLAFNGKIHPGVKVDKVNLSNLTIEEAQEKLKNSFSKLPDKNFTIKYKSRDWTVRPSDFDIRLKVKVTAEKAFAYGRHGNIITRLYEKFRAIIGADINSSFKMDKKETENFVKGIVDSVSSEPQNADIELATGKPVLTKSKEGYGLDYKKTFSDIVNGLCSIEEKSIVLKPSKLMPKIDNKEAAASLNQAKMMVSNKIALRYKKKRYFLTKADIAYSFSTNPLSDGDGLYLYIEGGKLKERLVPKIKGILSQPVSASFHVDGSDVWISPSKYGLSVKFDKTAVKATAVSKKAKNRATWLIVSKKKPNRTTAEAKKMGVKTLISSFTTNYPPGKPRVTNIHKAADILDRRMIAPGATFSFNGFVGQRQSSNGFIAAPEIRSGELVPTIGGGICQVATTFFNTILLGGYPFGQRSPHTLYISKYPNGRDAAVSWPSPDLTFTNDTNAWILIKGSYSDTSITINFYSTNYGRKVSFDTKYLGTIPFGTREIKDNTLEKGKRVQKEAGSAGRIYEVTRTVTKNGKIIRKETFRSSYRAKDRVVRVGTKPKAKKKKKEETNNTGTR